MFCDLILIILQLFVYILFIINFFQASLLSKKEKLQGQLIEAKTLQENIDRRSKVVQNILQKYLSMYELQDYENFVGKKSKFIMETREISDRIALCEEQMRNLTKKQNL